MTDHHQRQTIDKAENIRDDLVAIARSDLPFSDDAEQILSDLREQEQEQTND